MMTKNHTPVANQNTLATTWSYIARSIDMLSAQESQDAQVQEAIASLQATMRVLSGMVELDWTMLRQTFSGGDVKTLDNLIARFGVQSVRDLAKEKRMIDVIDALFRKRHFDMVTAILEHEIASYSYPEKFITHALDNDSVPAFRAWDAIVTRLYPDKKLAFWKLACTCKGKMFLSRHLAQPVAQHIAEADRQALALDLIQILQDTTDARIALKTTAIAIMSGAASLPTFQTLHGIDRMVFTTEGGQMRQKIMDLVAQAGSNHGMITLLEQEDDLLSVLEKPSSMSFFGL